MIAILLSLIVTAVSIPFAIIAEDNTVTQNANAENTESSEVVENGSEALIEDLSKRDKFTKHYAAPGGERYAVVFSEQVHYEENGEWFEVDNRLTLDTVTQRYETANTVFSADFAANAGDDSLVSISDGEYTISWSVLFPTSNGGHMSATANAQLINNGESASITTVDNMESMGKASSSLRYNGLGGGNVDLRYTVLHGKVEEDIILNSLDSFSAYMLSVNTGGLTAAVDEYGGVTFSDDDGNVIFTIAAPWMMDANSELSDAIAVEAMQKDDIALIAYTPDRSWLSDPERAYPVLIDPSFTTRYYTNNYVDTYVSEEETTPNLSKSTAVRLKLGKSRGYYNCPYIKILNVPDLVGQFGNIIEAKFNLWIGGYTGLSEAFLYEVNSSWNVSTITYANQPSSTLITSDELILLDEEWQTLSKYEFDITSWLNNICANHTTLSSYFESDLWNGFKLHLPTTANGNVITAFSSEYTTADHRPTLTIKYSYVPHGCLDDGAVYSFLYTTDYLSIDGGNAANGANIYLDRDNQKTAPQLEDTFKLIYVETSDAFLIASAESTENDLLVLTAPFNTTIDNTTGYESENVTLCNYSSARSDDQEWIIGKVEGTDKFKIALRSDPNLVLTAEHQWYDNGENPIDQPGNVYVRAYDGSIVQHWGIESGGNSIKNTSERIEYFDSFDLAIDDNVHLFLPVYNYGDTVTWSSSNVNIATVDENGNVVGKDMGSASILANIHHADDNSTSSHSILAMVHLKDGLYLIQNCGTSKYISIENNLQTNNEILQIGSFFTGDRIQWQIEWQFSNYYLVKSVHSNLYLGVNPNEPSSLLQIPITDYYTTWEIEKTSSGNFKMACTGNNSYNNSLGASYNSNADSISLTQVYYDNDDNYNDEWNLREIKYTATINNYYDLGYLQRYNQNENEAINSINEYSLAVAERYMELFGLYVNYGDAVYYESSADICKLSIQNADVDTLCPHQETNHTDRNTLLNDFKQNNEINVGCTNILWSGHRITSEAANGNLEYNRSVYSGNTILMINICGNDNRNQKSMSVLMHELNHQYGAKDHYHEEDETGNCKNVNCSICDGELYPSSCIMNSTNGSILSPDVICNSCRNDIIDILEKSYKFEN